jgi:hypothetical protein
MSKEPDQLLADVVGALAAIPAGPYDVYEDYEHGLNLIDKKTRVVLSDAYAYDRNDNERDARMEATARILNLAPKLVEALANAHAEIRQLKEAAKLTKSLSERVRKSVGR